MIKAAGTMILTARDGKALFLKRSADSDHPGEWCFPGGKVEPGETPDEAAERETREEIGAAPYSNPTLWARRIAEGVDFTTFVAKTKDEFTPQIDAEHVAWTWAPVSDPPEPLHPGARVALARLTMDELGIARAMAAGDLTSPQKYGNVWLFSIRITGTGVAYREGLNEYCWRDPAIYLDPEFLARCNGLPVILNHPDKKPALDSKEFRDRIAGTVFLPFVKGDEVWAVVKIWHDECANFMLDDQVSTSPGVVFRASTSTNETIKLSDGSTLLLEGSPAVLDHIAICSAGVWDKGGPPTGVLNDFLTKETIGMAENTVPATDAVDMKALLDAIKGVSARMDSVVTRLDSVEMADKARKDAEEKARMDKSRRDAARKDRFGARKDGESYKDWKSRHDADEMAMCDAMRKDGDDEEEAKKCAKDARKDAEDAEKESDKEFSKWAEEEMEEPNHRDDKARKDAEAAAEKAREDARKDAAVNAENADLKARLAAMEATLRGITAETPASERDALASAQARADSVAAMFGDKAAPPIPGEKPLDYRKRLLSRFQRHSERFKDSRFDGLDDASVGVIEDVVYMDSLAAARSPTRAGPGRLHEIVETDRAGRRITKFTGDIAAWMTPFMGGGRVTRITKPRSNLA